MGTRITRRLPAAAPLHSTSRHELAYFYLEIWTRGKL